MASKTQRAKEDFKSRLQDMIGSPDRWGNFKFEVKAPLGEIDTYRFKLQKTSWRLERKTALGGQAHWMKVQGEYYTNESSIRRLVTLANYFINILGNTHLTMIYE